MSNIIPEKSSLQLLLFVDRRPGSREQIRQIRAILHELQQSSTFDLKIVNVVDHPYLAEQFRIVATPSLVKVFPEPKQILAGVNIISQLKLWWGRWESSASQIAASNPFSQTDPKEFESTTDVESSPEAPIERLETLGQQAEVFRLTDELFKVRQENAELTAQLRFRNQVIAMLAHDLRNPLTAASIAAETLEIANRQVLEDINDPLTPTLRGQLISQARVQLRTMNQMITHLLEASNGSQSGLTMQPIPVTLNLICQEVIQDFAANLEEKQQQLKTDIPSDLPLVYGDPDRIKQVLTNLFDNAIKYSPNSGHITLSVLHRTTQKIQISICDEGPGIPEPNRVRIFEEHYRLKRDEGEKGYGIGLSLCQRIVRAHYGEIWVDTSAGQGSCFHFTLPVYR